MPIMTSIKAHRISFDLFYLYIYFKNNMVKPIVYVSNKAHSSRTTVENTSQANVTFKKVFYLNDMYTFIKAIK